VPAYAYASGIFPVKFLVYDLGGAVNALGLTARGRVGSFDRIAGPGLVKTIDIASWRIEVGQYGPVVTLRQFFQRHAALMKRQLSNLDPFDPRRAHQETAATVTKISGTQRCSHSAASRIFKKTAASGGSVRLSE